jgi:hypothetical protein
MAYAGDLKSPDAYASCGFDPHPGHHSFLLEIKELLCQPFPCTSGVPQFAKEPADRGNGHKSDPDG